MKTALVTGGAGFIGGALVRYLQTRSEYREIVVVDNLVTNPRGTPEGCQFVHGDIRNACDVARIQELGPFDEIYHCAASFANELSVKYPRVDFETNVHGTVNLLTELAGSFGHFIYTGSSSSYGNSRGEAFTEDSPLFPGTPYAISKHAGEEYVRVLAERYTIFRFFNVFGPGDVPGPWRNAIPNMVWRARSTGSFVTFGEEKGAARDFTYIDDVVRAMSVASWLPENQVFNLCSGEPTAIRDIAYEIQQWTGAEVRREEIRTWDGVITRWGDNSRITSALDAIGVDSEFRSFDGECARETLEWLDRYLADHQTELQGWLEDVCVQ